MSNLVENRELLLFAAYYLKLKTTNVPMMTLITFKGMTQKQNNIQIHYFLMKIVNK